MKRGRRTLLTTKLQSQLCGYLSDCCTIRTAAEASGISESSFFLWLEKGEKGQSPYKEFSEAVARARGRAKARIVRSLLDEKDWRPRLEMLSRVFPDEYGRIDARPLPKEREPERQGPVIEYSFSLPDGTKIPTTFEEAQKVFCNFPIRDTHDAQPEQRSPNTAITHRPVVGAGGHVIGWTDEDATDADADLP